MAESSPPTDQSAEQAAKSPKPAKAAKPKGEPVTAARSGRGPDADGADRVHPDVRRPPVVVLDAGPTWFYGDDHPLAGSVGKQVTIVGTQRAG